MSKPSSTQVGAIAENLVANVLMIASNGRLSPFQPVADDDGIDLLIYDKVTGRALPAQIKSRTVALKKRGSSERGNLIHFELRKATFRVDRYACAILVLLNEDSSRIECAWVIPMKDVPSYAAARAKKYVVRASKAAGTKDRCSGFQCRDNAAFAARIMALLEEAPPAADL